MITCVVGARPNFVKAAPVIRALKARGVQVRLVNTGQHYDYALAWGLVRQLDMPEPDVDFMIGSAGQVSQTAAVMVMTGADLVEHPADALVVFGDVNSTLGAALAGAKQGVPVVHVESGLRSGDRTMPEEINRIVVDHVSDLLLCTSVEGTDNLAKEGLTGNLVGNTMIDSLFRVLPRARECQVPPDGFILVTLHRPNVVDDSENLAAVVKVLQDAPTDVVFPVHPRTKRLLGDTDGIITMGPVDYVTFVSMMASAKLVITDSGGVQEETTALGVPCLTYRNNTERGITCELGTNRLVGTNPLALASAIRNTLRHPPSPVDAIAGWDGHAGERAADEIVKWLS